MIKILRSQRGYMLLNVIFLTLITSFAAQILLNAVPRVRNPGATFKITALYLANEQFALLESRAASGEEVSGNYNFLGDSDTISYNLSAENPVEFKVETTVEGGTAKIVVKWEIGGREDKIELERTISGA